MKILKRHRNVVSYRNSTSNHNSVNGPLGQQGVVSYRNSTSNHNNDAVSMSGVSVVSYRNSTSNHNLVSDIVIDFKLYLIEILHQTTTWGHPYLYFSRCILSKFYIKPQPIYDCSRPCLGCILSKFYIKPQLIPNNTGTAYSCILSKFYIKPQLELTRKFIL